MEAYTIEGKKCDFNTDTLFKQGFFGKVYLTDDNKCLKVFKEPLIRGTTFDFEEDTYNEIRKLKLNNFYELYDLYYNKELTQILGYLSKYYQNENIDILTMPTDYTLNNLCQLYNSFEKLSEHNIFTNDIHSGNVIINSKEIVVIDTDLYYKSGLVEEEPTLNILKEKSILNENISNLSDLFIDIYLSSLSKHSFYGKYDRVDISEKIQRLFTSMNITNGVDPVIKRLIKHKYPIDYLRKK